MKLTHFSVDQISKMLLPCATFHASRVKVLFVQMAKGVLHTHFVVKLGKSQNQHHLLPQSQQLHWLLFIVVCHFTMLRLCVNIHVLVVYPKIALEIFSALPVHLAVTEVPSSVERRGKMQRLDALNHVKMA